MKTIYKFLATLFFIVLIGVSSFFYGQYRSSDNDKIEITSSTILERITDKYFIVTKTLLLDEETKIMMDKGSDWNNLLWGQEIDAHATIRVDIGVDMNKLKKEDIVVNETEKIISIVIPHAQILNSSIQGKFEVETTDGIMKKIFKDTTNDDYNKAVKIMKEQAEEKIVGNKEILEEAEKRSLQLLQLILDNLGYRLEFSY